MKKVLIFSTAYFPFIGGAEIAVKELTDRIEDYEFDLITARMERRLLKKEKIGRVNVYRVGFGNKFDKFLLPFLGLCQALRLERLAKHEIIFSLMASQASVAAAFFKITKPEKKLILNLQEGDEEEHLKRYVFNSDFLFKLLIRPWHLLVFKKADLAIAISAYLKKRALGNDVKCPIEVVPNGVDATNYELRITCLPDRQANYELKKNLGFKENDKILITVSRLVKKNAVDDIIKALEYLPDNVKLLILGEGSERDKLAGIAKELKLIGRVKFFGQIENSDLPKYLAIADVFVRPSISEGLGISFLEAMAAGAPIIGTPVGGIPDFLINRETGLFCEPGNPKDLAEKIKIYLNDNELREKIIKQAKELVKEKYDWNKIAAKIKVLFEKI